MITIIFKIIKIWLRSDLFQKPWQHLSSLNSYQLLLHLHCVEQSPHIHFESAHNTLQ